VDKEDGVPDRGIIWGRDDVDAERAMSVVPQGGILEGDGGVCDGGELGGVEGGARGPGLSALSGGSTRRRVHVEHRGGHGAEHGGQVPRIASGCRRVPVVAAELPEWPP